jgi:phosphate transport system substrate-binding protein
MKWLVGIAALVVVLVGLSLILGGGRSGAVNVVGSTSIQPFAEMLAQAYQDSHADSYVDVQGGGSTAGLQAAANGLAQIGMCSRALTPDEATEFQSVVIARDGLAIVVHSSNPIEGLSRDQIRRIFAGEIRNWTEVGGPDRPVRPITREEGSGTREAFVKLVMGKVRIARQALTQESNGAVKELVRNDPAGVGYMSLGLVGGELRAVAVDGVAPTSANVVAGKYPLVRPFLFVTVGKPSEKARAFIDFVLSPEGQRMIENEGLVAAK